MESINRLRAYVERHARMGSMTKAILTEMASVIEHDVECERTAAYNAGYDAGFVDDNYDADATAQHEDAMAERGWVRLPVSEDGGVLHIGELVDEKLPFGGYAPPAPIDTMELSRGASGYGWMVKLDAENRALINPKLLRHHHAPTVEDVTCEFLQDLSDWLGLALDIDYIKADGLFAEYAARLRLAGEE